MKVLADTNILIDYLCRRHPFDEEAKFILFGCAMGDYELWISSSQVTDLFFLLTHGAGCLSAQEARGVLQQLRKYVRVGSLREEDVDAALDCSWKDFEDACVHQVARHLKCDYLVTRNEADFEKPTLHVLSPKQFLNLLGEQQQIFYSEISLT
ncbi:MAG: PIN domain-containing protein [Coriobacteriia bacterium]|nr:PIN domain-containing protein [Coriobacteriia bacterium]